MFEVMTAYVLGDHLYGHTLVPPQAGIPIFPMHTFETLLEDAHLKATGFFQEVEHPAVGRIRQMAIPSEWSGTVPETYNLAPTLGEHTAEILREVGYSDAQIADVNAARERARSPR